MLAEKDRQPQARDRLLFLVNSHTSCRELLRSSGVARKVVSVFSPRNPSDRFIVIALFIKKGAPARYALLTN
jgi:hypothetical protein